MKKLLWPVVSLIGLLIGICLGYSVARQKEPDSIKTNLLVKGCGAQDPKTQVCPDSARVIVKNYKTNTVGGNENTRCVWFSMERIRTLDSLLKKEKSDGLGTDGIRIYFGTYPQYCKPGVNHPHAFRNTILFVSTKDSLQKFHRDYFTTTVHMIPENKGELCPPGDCYANGALLLK